MGAYVLTVLGGLLLLYAGYLAIVGALTSMAPGRFVRAIGGVQLLAFSTSSSAAVMPLSIETAVSKLGVSEQTANLVIPLGAPVNMAGTALYQRSRLSSSPRCPASICRSVNSPWSC